MPGIDGELALAVVADVDHAQVGHGAATVDERGRRQPGRPLRRARAAAASSPAMSSTTPTTRSKPMRPMRRRASSASDRLVAKQDDVVVGAHDHADVLGEPAVQPDVDRTGQVATGERHRVAHVDQDGARVAAAASACERSRSAHRRQVQQLVIGLVRGDRVREVRRRRGLVGGDDRDELLGGHRRERVVRPLLLTDGRDGLGGEVLAARRARAVRRVDERRVGQRHELVAQRVVQRGAQLLGGDARPRRAGRGVRRHR